MLLVKHQIPTKKLRFLKIKNEEFRSAYYSIFLLNIILIFGIIGYVWIERYSLLDAFFMTIITVATVGYGEVHPLSPEGKIFTSLLIIFSFGIFTFAASTLTRYIVSGVFRNYYKYSKVKKEIDKLENHVIVVGYGRNGLQAIEELQHHHISVIVIDNREAKIKEIQQKSKLLYIQDDPSSDEVLARAGIKRAKAFISVLPTDAENLFAVISARELNPHITIISRAINFNTIKKLKTAGASHVIMPDKISGQHMAKMIAQPNIVEFLDYLMIEKSKDIILEEIACYEVCESYTIEQLKTFTKDNINIIGLKRNDGSYIVNPGMDIKLTIDDRLFVLGNQQDINRFKNYINDAKD